MFGLKNFQKNGPVKDINVTPLVDVTLVLLIIFMVTAPLLLNGIKLTLPKTREVNSINLTTSQVILSMTRAGDLFIGKDKILMPELIDEIGAQFEKTKTDVLYLRADYSIKYGDVAKIMSFLKKGGIHNIALVTETDKKLTD